MAKADLLCPQCKRTFAAPADRCPVDGAPLYGPEVMERVNQKIHSYMVHGILGEGGMGVVYKAEHIMLKKPVAMKVLHERFARRKGAANQFLREARAASQIRHPNIVDVTDFGETPDGALFFVMEYLEGESLEDVLAREGRVPLHNAVNIVNQMALALLAANEFGVIHQDLKPDNVFLINREGRRRIVRRIDRSTGERFIVENEGSFDFVKILDFGVAKFAMETHDGLGPGLKPKTGMVFGTPQYMSPEQAQGLPVDARSDVYSVGILFYEMLLGVVPFDSDSSLEILNGHVSGRVVPPKDRDPDVLLDETTNRTIMRCLAKRPEDRYQSMDELRVALRECFTDRVYLRDAHLLPGAVESGVVPASRPPAEVGAAPPAPPTSPAAGTARKKRLSEDLADLFGGDAPPKAAPQTGPPAAAAPAAAADKRVRGVPPATEPEEPTREMPQNDRSKTHQGLGAVQGLSPGTGGPVSRTTRKRPTAPLAQRNKNPSR